MDITGQNGGLGSAPVGSIPGLGRSPGKGKGYPFQYSGLENSIDCIGSIHGVQTGGHKELEMTE